MLGAFRRMGTYSNKEEMVTASIQLGSHEQDLIDSLTYWNVPYYTEVQSTSEETVYSYGDGYFGLNFIYCRDGVVVVIAMD